MPQLRLKDYLVIVGGILLLTLSLIRSRQSGRQCSTRTIRDGGQYAPAGYSAGNEFYLGNRGSHAERHVERRDHRFSERERHEHPAAIAETAQKAVNHSFVCSSTAVGCGEGAATEYEAPTGYQLVIDYASIAASNLPVGDAAVLNIVTTVNSVFASFQVPQSQMVKLYADAGTTVQLSADRASNVGGGPDTSYFVSFTGHLVPLP